MSRLYVPPDESDNKRKEIEMKKMQEKSMFLGPAVFVAGQSSTKVERSVKSQDIIQQMPVTPNKRSDPERIERLSTPRNLDESGRTPRQLLIEKKNAVLMAEVCLRE